MMTREQRIASAILTLNGGEYQALVSDYLQRSLGYTNVIAVGMKPGTTKTRRGTPDTFYNSGSRCTLMEAGSYGGSGDALTKIKKDIDKCNVYKDAHPELEVERIIIAYMCTNIDPSELLEIESEHEEVELLGLDKLAHGLLAYPWLVKEHLGIPMPSDQVLDIDAFIAKVENDPFSPSISCSMVGREELIGHVFELVSDGKSVLLSGPSGSGKTRTALEVAKKYKMARPDAAVWCVRSLKRDLYEDMQIALEGREYVLVFLDDIDGIMGLSSLLELCRESGVTVLATVRNSVLDDIHADLRILEDLEMLPVEPMSDDAVLEVLRESFGIESVETRIVIRDKCHGNLRFAQLVAESLKSGDLKLANDPHEMIERAYHPIIDRLGRHERAALEILSVLGATRFESVVLDWLLGIWGLDVDDFKVACRLLHDKELVSLTSLESAVGLVEQNLGDFLLYHVIFGAKRISLKDLWSQGLGPRLLTPSIEVLCVIFRSDESVRFARKSLDDIWDFDAGSHAFLCERFGSLIGDRCELHIIEEIEVLESDSGRSLNKGGVDGIVRHILTCLRAIREDVSRGDDIVDLFLRLADTGLADTDELVEFASTELSFSSGKALMSPDPKICLIEALTERCEGSEDDRYGNLLVGYVKALLQDMVTRTVSSTESKLTYVYCYLVMHDDVLAVRDAALKALVRVSNNERMRECAVEVLGSYRGLMPETPAETVELRAHTAGMVARVWSTFLPLRTWAECMQVCDFIEDWVETVDEAAIQLLMPDGSVQKTVAAVRGFSSHTTEGKRIRDKAVKEAAYSWSEDDILMPFESLDEAWLCDDRELQEGYGQLIVALDELSHELALHVFNAYVRSGFKPSYPMYAPMGAIVDRIGPRKARTLMRLLTSGSRGGVDVARQWRWHLDYDCIVRCKLDGVAQEIADCVLNDKRVLTYEEMMKVDAEVEGFADRYLDLVCNDVAFGAGTVEWFLQDVEDMVQESCIVPDDIRGIRQAKLEALVIKAFVGGAYVSDGLLCTLCRWDDSFVDSLVDVALAPGGFRCEEKFGFVWKAEPGVDVVKRVCESACSKVGREISINGVYRVLVSVVSSMPSEGQLRMEMIDWFAKLAECGEKPDAILCEAVSSSLPREDRLCFAKRLIDLGLSTTEIRCLCCCRGYGASFSGSELSIIDADVVFLSQLKEQLSGVKYLRYRRAIDDEIGRLTQLKEGMEAREMTSEGW